MSLAMTAAELHEFLTREFPQAHKLGFKIELAEDRLRILLESRDSHLRPGGTVSGPTMMLMADTAMYLALLSRIGPVATAVTTDLSIHFLRRPDPGVLVAECEILKLGSRLAVGAVRIYSQSEAEPVAHATVTYAVPTRRRKEAV